MKLANCPSCGGRELVEENGMVVCVYCRSKFVAQADDALPTATVIGIPSDIEVLLKKCKEEPSNRRMYANLILDIDPTNSEATQYL
jgi:hypothetical protein